MNVKTPLLSGLTGKASLVHSIRCSHLEKSTVDYMGFFSFFGKRDWQVDVLENKFIGTHVGDLVAVRIAVLRA